MKLHNSDNDMKIRRGAALDDSHLKEEEDAIHVSRTLANKRLAEQMETHGNWSDELDLRAELQDYYEQYNALERRRLRLIYETQRTVLVDGKSDIDPGTLVMILNLARMG